MIFSSTLFLFIFFPLTIAGYYLLKGNIRNIWLFFMSFIFFGWSQPKYILIIIFSILINYWGAILLVKFKKNSKAIMISTVLINLFVLFYFKYFNFILDSINRIIDMNYTYKDIVLPIGISFFTFQGISYVVDVYRKDVAVQKNLLKMGLYVVLFPQLIAGPIVRYKDIAEEIDSRQVTLIDFSDGLEGFIIGLGKKVVIANTMALVVDKIWNANKLGNSVEIAWVGSIAYTLQILYDFSGYSDMAIGLGRMFGFHFYENFNLPYISKSITEFWRRWHISLSSWFRDYVYIPLGGNRKNEYLNLAIVFLLTGIWHGAAWHYIIWGIWNGVFILLERIHKKTHPMMGVYTDKKNQSTLVAIILKIYCLLIINIGWVLFRAPDMSEAIKYIRTLFGMNIPVKNGCLLAWYMDGYTTIIMILGIIFASSIPYKIGHLISDITSENVRMCIKYSFLLLLFSFSIMRIVAGTYNPFIYFQF